MRSARTELGWLIGALVLIFFLARYTALDHALTGLFYDPVAQRFPLKDQALWAVVMHTGLKYLSIGIWLALLGAWLALRRRPSWRRYRTAAGFTLWVAPLAALVVSSLRAVSPHSCPWDLSLFGGTAEYFRFLDAVPPNAGAGRCAPSGHAAAGFAWFAGYFAARGVSRTLARSALSLALALGVLTGLTQLARGAHFLSHVLLTAWICFAVAWVADRLRKKMAL